MLKLVGIFVVIVVCCSVVQDDNSSYYENNNTAIDKETGDHAKEQHSSDCFYNPADNQHLQNTVYYFVTVCSDTNSTATSGIIQPLANVTIENSNYCDFTIIVPSDQLISGAVDYDANFQLVPNRVYNSWINEIQLHSRVCRYAETTTAIGTIQSMSSIDDDTGPPRTCPFFINAPTNYQVQLSCSVLNFTDTFPQIFYALDEFNQKPVENRVYTSLKNQMFLYFYRPVIIDWFRCNWTMVPIPPSTMTDFRLCRHGEARTADGTIQPLINDLTGPPRDCIFSIIAPVDQFLSISCSFANFTSARNFVRLSGIAYTDTFVSKLRCARPELGKTYTSVDNRIDLSARIENGNWFKCNWTTTTIGPTPTTTQNGIYKLCRDTNSTAANGTIQPLSFSAASGGCSFTIQAPPNQRIQLSCSVIDGMSLRVVGAVINTLSPTSYIDAGVNRVYTSLENQLQLTSTNVNSSGWIDCKWTTIPAISDNATKFECNVTL
uniref:CUB domain-containing protein n=1 Tax=Daphnia galeata TaxID=27404 RepID=A0A8J2WAG1_9CRUS|nr:unnamed protein product [Daphnia galeata]